MYEDLARILARPHYRHRLQAEIISHTVWLYYRTFCLRALLTMFDQVYLVHNSG